MMEYSSSDWMSLFHRTKYYHLSQSGWVRHNFLDLVCNTQCAIKSRTIMKQAIDHCFVRSAGVEWCVCVRTGKYIHTHVDRKKWDDGHYHTSANTSCPPFSNLHQDNKRYYHSSNVCVHHLCTRCVYIILCSFVIDNVQRISGFLLVGYGVGK